MAGAQDSKGELPHSFASDQERGKWNGKGEARERILSEWVDARCSIRSGLCCGR